MCSTGAVSMDPTTQVVAPTTNLRNLCQIWDLFSNAPSGTVVPQNSGPTSFTAPAVTAPSFPSFSQNCQIPSTTIAPGPAVTLPPGSYGQIIVPTGATVDLQAGTYTICSFLLDPGATVNTVSGVVL